MAKQKVKYNSFYMTKEESLKDKENIITLYEEPTRKLQYSSLVGVNYHGVKKKELVCNVMYLINREDSIIRELMDERIRNNILTKRMTEAGMNTVMTPDEIYEYEETLGASLSADIDRIMSEPSSSIREEVLGKVKMELAKVKGEVEKDFRYNIIRLENSIKYCDMLENDIMSANSKKMTLKDKGTTLSKVQKDKMSLIKMLKETLVEVGISIKDTSDEFNTKKSNERTRMGSLSSMVK